MPLFLEILFWVLWLLVLCSAGYCGVCLVAAFDFFHFAKREAKKPKTFTPPVSIFKPVRGVDDRAYECWVSFCRQDYPDFELIFGVQNGDDPAIPSIRRLQQEFPKQAVKLVINSSLIGPSGKVSNLHNMFPSASHEIVIVSDSDILVEPDYLKTVVAPLENPQVGVVTCMYRGIGGRSIPAILEALGITCDFLLGVLVARKLQGLKFALGSTIVTRKEVLAAYGGFPAIADNLADDYLMGFLAAEAGYEVVLSPYVVGHVIPNYRFGEFFSHQLRWARAIKCSRPAGFVGLLFTQTTILALALVLWFPFSKLGWATAGMAWLFRFSVAWVIGIEGLKDVRLKPYFFLLPVRDIINFFVWAFSFVGNSVSWRGEKFRILAGGKLVPLKGEKQF